jgi:hypothetical protein
VLLLQGLVRPLRVQQHLSASLDVVQEVVLLQYPRAVYPLPLLPFPRRQREARLPLLDRVAILFQGLHSARGQGVPLSQGLDLSLRVLLLLLACPRLGGELTLLMYPQAVYPQPLPLFPPRQREARLPLLDQAATLLQGLPLPRGQGVPLSQGLDLSLRVQLLLLADLDVVQEAVLLQYPQAVYPQPLPPFILRQREARVGLLGQHKQLCHLVLLLHGVDKLSQGRHREP